MVTATVEPEGLNLSQAARFLGMHRNTLQKLIGEGKVPHQRIGPRSVRFSRSELRDWLAGQSSTN